MLSDSAIAGDQEPVELCLVQVAITVVIENCKCILHAAPSCVQTLCSLRNPCNYCLIHNRFLIAGACHEAQATLKAFKVHDSGCSWIKMPKQTFQLLTCQCWIEGTGHDIDLLIPQVTQTTVKLVEEIRDVNASLQDGNANAVQEHLQRTIQL